MGVPINSIDISYKDEAPYLMVAGTFNGAVCIVLYESGKVISKIDNCHAGYISAICVIQQVEELHFATLSNDKLIIWELETAKQIIEVTMAFSDKGDFKWWDVLEIQGSMYEGNILMAVCASRDKETRIVKINFSEVTGET